MTTIQVTETGTGTILPTEEGYYEEPGLEVNRGPVGYVKVGDFDGTLQAVVTPGVIMEVYEDAVRKFVGIVEKRKRTRGIDGFYLEATFRDLAYHYLRATPCDPYTYSETGEPETARDAVKVNPWRWPIFRNPFGTVLDVDGNPAFCDGVPIDVAYQGLAGSKFVFCHRFEDDRIFRPSDLIGGPGDQARVIADKLDDVEVPSLQRLKGPLGYLAHSSFLRTIPLESGDPNVTPMGTLQNLTVVLVGSPALSGSTDPVVEVTRNARAGAPTWAAVSLVANANWNGSGLTAWIGTVTFAGAAGASAAVRLKTGSTGTTDTNRLYWMRLEGDLATLDTGLNGAIVHDVYVDPAGLTGAALCVDDDFEGLSRGDALERLRLTTLTTVATNPGPHWDIWCDLNQFIHFAHRRGTVRANEFSLDDDTLQVLQHEQFAEDLAYQVIAEGGGTGESAFTLTDRVDYAAGGLYSAARDPSAAVPLYGDLPRAIIFRDQGSQSRADLRRRARAHFRDRLDPMDFYLIRIPTTGARFYTTGDSIVLTDDVILLNASRRITGLKVQWSGSSGHFWDVTLGHTLANPTTLMGGSLGKLSQAQKANILAAANKGVGGPGVYCDATHYGRASFVIPDKVEVDRVLMTIRSLPWQIYSRDAVSETGGTGSATGHNPFTTSFYEDWLSIQSTFTDFGTSFAQDVSTAAELAYVEVLWGTWNDADNKHEARPEFRIVRTNGAHSGEVVAIQNYSATADAATPQDQDDTVFTLFRVTLEKTTVHPILPGDTFKVQYKSAKTSGSGTWTDKAVVYITFQYQHYHPVPLTFGIWGYDGDGGDGDGIPVYGKCYFAVDPVTDILNGEPTGFSSDRHPDEFGDNAIPVSRTYDVTPYLRRSPDNRVEPGEHEVILLGIPTTWSGDASRDNAEALGTFAVTTRLIAAEGTG